MSHNWKFVAKASSSQATTSWSWIKCADDVAIQESRDRFSDFEACVFDARVNGFSTGEHFEVIEDRRGSRRFLAPPSDT